MAVRAEVDREERRQAQVAECPDGRALGFAEWGAPQGAPVFSLHGTPGCRLLGSHQRAGGFEQALVELDVRLITYDRPGYGKSDRQPGRCVGNAAADVSVLADLLGIDRFALEGTSGGSAHALGVAARLDGRVGRVACVAPMAPYEALGAEAWSDGQDPALRTLVRRCLAGPLDAAQEIDAEDELARRLAVVTGNPNPEIFEWTRRGIWGWVDDALALLAPWGFETEAVQADALVVYDPDDPLFPARHAEWLGRQLPRCALQETPALGHAPIADPLPHWVALYEWLAQSVRETRG